MPCNARAFWKAASTDPEAEPIFSSNPAWCPTTVLPVGSCCEKKYDWFEHRGDEKARI